MDQKPSHERSPAFQQRGLHYLCEDRTSFELIAASASVGRTWGVSKQGKVEAGTCRNVVQETVTDEPGPGFSDQAAVGELSESVVFCGVSTKTGQAHFGRQWAAFILSDRKDALIAIDWTEFDKDAHSTLGASAARRGHRRGRGSAVRRTAAPRRVRAPSEAQKNDAKRPVKARAWQFRFAVRPKRG